MSDPNVCVPSQTEKGPIHARDIELARMPCYMGLDYPDDDGHIPETCALCFDDLTPESIFRRLPCKHLFHKQCIDKWLCTRDGSCPFCRQTFYHLRKPFVVGNTLPAPEIEHKDELQAGRDAFVLWWKQFLGLELAPGPLGLGFDITVTTFMLDLYECNQGRPVHSNIQSRGNVTLFSDCQAAICGWNHEVQD